MRTIDADRLKAVLEKNFGHTGGASVLEQLIDEQPTIEPSTNCSEIPNSSDTVSRQAAIDIVVFECGKWTGLAKEISKQLKQLPSAQPEPHEGHWIGKYPTTHICSECGWLIPDSKVKVFAYCPNCGADMRGEKDG